MPDQNALQDNVLPVLPGEVDAAGYTNPINDFFHKYLVTAVAETRPDRQRRTGSSPTTTTSATRPGTTPTTTG